MQVIPHTCGKGPASRSAAETQSPPVRRNCPLTIEYLRPISASRPLAPRALPDARDRRWADGVLRRVVSGPGLGIAA